MATRKEEQKALGREVAAFFTRKPGVEFVGFAGVGRHGGALILAERDDEGGLRRKLVVKYSLGELTGDPDSNADEDLRNEYHWLEKLRGAEHIVRLVRLADCSLMIPGTSNGENTYEASVAKATERDEALRSQLEGGGDRDEDGTKVENSRARKCPTFALEYLPHGPLSETVLKLQADKTVIPNRILWRIWLCFVRQCVAMAFPPMIPMSEEDDGRSIREQIIPDQPYCTLTQNSAHLENWLWGPEPPGGIEDEDHDPGIPVIKLIDFGRGRLEDLREYTDDELDNLQECGSRRNLWHAALAMLEMCLPLEEVTDLVPHHQYPYTYSKGGRTFEIETFAPALLRLATSIDLELRDTLVRCLADLPGDVPPLREVLEEAEAAVANRGLDEKLELLAFDVHEDDRYFRRWVQTYIYDAFWADDEIEQ